MNLLQKHGSVGANLLCARSHNGVGRGGGQNDIAVVLSFRSIIPIINNYIPSYSLPIYTF